MTKAPETNGGSFLGGISNLIILNMWSGLTVNKVSSIDRLRESRSPSIEHGRHQSLCQLTCEVSSPTGCCIAPAAPFESDDAFFRFFLFSDAVIVGVPFRRRWWRIGLEPPFAAASEFFANGGEIFP